VEYVAVDVSSAMVLVAREVVGTHIGKDRIRLAVCDLESGNAMSCLKAGPFSNTNVLLYTFYGMIPNSEPHNILPKLQQYIAAYDANILLSANLAPGGGYAEGVQKVLPLYANLLTTNWLEIFLLDLGVEPGDGQVRFSVQPDPQGLLRIEAHYHFTETREVRVGDTAFQFKTGDAIRLFFSYRYTPELLQRTLNRYGLRFTQSWIADSGEEGVFLVGRLPV
jgi:hypothetical protein